VVVLTLETVDIGLSTCSSFLNDVEEMAVGYGHGHEHETLDFCDEIVPADRSEEPEAREE
jgi:hypothetical protein